MPSFPISFPSSSEDLVIVSDKGSYYLLEYNSPPDNRYTKRFLSAYLDALDYLRINGEAKILITTSRIPKFFSNGLDFEAAIADADDFFPNYYYKLMHTMLTYPYPTIAVVNGHGFAAGFMVAVCHDYRVMNPEKGFLCMNEVAFGATLLPPMMSIFRVKFGVQLSQKIALQAHRFSGPEALKLNIVDAVGGLPEAEKIAERPEVKKYIKSRSYALIRRELLKEVISDTLTYEQDSKKLEKEAKDLKAYYAKRKSEIESKLAKL